jgi:hypothetical protein
VKLATAALAAGILMLGATGCQTTMGGQTLPSAYYLQDDIQYFKAGPEDKIWRERAALEEYKAAQRSLLPGEVRPPVGPPPAAPPVAPPAQPPAAAPPAAGVPGAPAPPAANP